MANAIDDLRYISRYGYRDPWAEATNNITNSLLAYAKSKNQRDTLLAQIEERKSLEAQRRIEAQRDDDIKMISLLPEDERGDYIRNKGLVGDAYQAVAKLSDEAKIKSDNKEGYLKTIRDPNAPIDDKLEAARTGFSQSDNTSDQSLFRNHITNISSQQSKLFEADSYRKLGELNKNILGDNYQSYTDAIDNGNFLLAKTIIEQQSRITGNTYQTLSSMYDNALSIYNNVKEKFDKLEAGEGELRAAENSLLDFQRRHISNIPPQFRDPNNNFAQSMSNWALNTRGQSAKTNLGVESGDGGVETGMKQTAQTTYKLMNDISEGDMRIPSTAVISLINPRTNKRYEQKFTSDTAQRLVETGQGMIDKKNAMIEFEWAGRENKAFRIDAGVRTMTYQSVKKPLLLKTRNERIELQSGDEVMEKSSGKRFPVIIDNPQGNQMRDKIGYIVNGKRYNFQQFINKFGKPMYDLELTQDSLREAQLYQDTINQYEYSDMSVKRELVNPPQQ